MNGNVMPKLHKAAVLALLTVTAAAAPALAEIQDVPGKTAQKAKTLQAPITVSVSRRPPRTKG